MKRPEKLKTERLSPAGRALVGGFVLLFLLLVAIWGIIPLFVMIGSLSFLFMIYHILILVRTRNIWFLISMGFYLFNTVFSLATVFGYQKVAIVSAFPSFFFLLGLMYMLFTHRIRFWNREILELAARSVQGVEDGFTDRPFPAGRFFSDVSEIHDFAGFLVKHLIVFPYRESDRVVLVISGRVFDHFVRPVRDFSRETYVEFTREGDMSVHITRSDYDKFREELTFDSLCQAAAALFVEFQELYRDNRESEILDQLKANRIGL